MISSCLIESTLPASRCPGQCWGCGRTSRCGPGKPPQSTGKDPLKRFWLFIVKDLRPFLKGFDFTSCMIWKSFVAIECWTCTLMMRKFAPSSNAMSNMSIWDHALSRIVKVRSKITYLTGSTQHEDHLVKNDHHVADVVAICVKTIRVGSSEYIFNI